MKITHEKMVWPKWTSLYFLFPVFLSTSTASEMKNRGQLAPSILKRSFVKDGDIILAGLLTIHHQTTDDNCGNIKLQGMAYLEAMIYAIEKINNDSRLLPNITLGYDIQDYCDNLQLASESAFAINTRNLLYEYLHNSNRTEERTQIASEIFGAPLKPVAAVIGTADSSSSMVVASMLQVWHIPQVSPFATSEELTSNKYKTFFRTVPSDRQQAKTIADIIDYFGWTYVTLIGVDSSYGRWGLLSLEREAQNRGTFCIHVSEIFPVTRYESKVKHIISRLKRETRSKVVVLWADPTTSLYVLEEARIEKVLGMTWLAPDGWSEAQSLFKQEFLPIIGGFLGTLFRKFDISDFKKYMLGLTRESRQNTWWRETWAHMDKQCAPNGKNISTVCVNNQYSKVTEQMYNEMHTAYIPYVIDAVYAVAHALDEVFRCKNGSGASSEDSCTNFQYHVNGKELLPYLSKVHFEGITGEINFDANGNSEQTASYTIVNLQPVTKANPAVRNVGSWTKQKKPRLRLQKSNIYWNNGSKAAPQSVCNNICPAGKRQSETVNCCWECYACSPSTHNNIPGSHNCTECPIDQKPTQDHTACQDLEILNIRISDVESIAIFVISGLGMTLLLFVLAVFIKLRHTALVKAANWELSCVLLFGISLGYVTSSLYVIQPTTLRCCLSEACSKMYVVVCVSVLFLKTNRLIHVFKVRVISSGLTKWIYSGPNQLVFILLLNAVPILALSVWFVFDTPTAKREIELLRAIHYECQVYKGTIGFSMHVVIFIYAIALSIVCTLYAFKARKLPENFNEAQYIGLAMYIRLFCGVTFFGIYNNIAGSQVALAYSSLNLVNTFGFLFCMFAPKIYVIFRHPERNTPEYVKSAVSNHNLMRQIKVHHGKPGSYQQETSMTNTLTPSEERELPTIQNGFNRLKHLTGVKYKKSQGSDEGAKGTDVVGDGGIENYALAKSCEPIENSIIRRERDSESKLSIDSTVTEVVEIEMNNP